MLIHFSKLGWKTVPRYRTSTLTPILTFSQQYLDAALAEPASHARAVEKSATAKKRARSKLNGKLNVRVNENEMFFKAKIKCAQNVNFHQFATI